MKSFRLQKPHGDQDVTHEAIMWLAVLVFLVAPALAIVYWILS